MNCTEFGTIVADIARGRPIEADQRAHAEAHTRTCASCRDQLAGERDVTEHLAALRAASRNVAAPAALEATLVAAFRAQAAPVAPPSLPAPSPIAPAGSSPARWWMTAAAALVFAAGAALAGSWYVGNRPAPGAASVEFVDATPTVPQPAAPVAEGGVAPVASVEVPRPAAAARSTSRRRPAVARPDDGSQPPVVYASLPAAVPRWSDEPLVPVRIQLPCAALPALGINVTREYWGETVPVEVLVGEDGIARGIRLVSNEDVRE